MAARADGAKRKRKRQDAAPETVFTTLDPSEPSAAFAAAVPYPHVQLSSIVSEPLLLKVRQELGLLQSTFKETDLFKVRSRGAEERRARAGSCMPMRAKRSRRSIRRVI